MLWTKRVHERGTEHVLRFREDIQDAGSELDDTLRSNGSTQRHHQQLQPRHTLHACTRTASVTCSLGVDRTEDRRFSLGVVSFGVLLTKVRVSLIIPDPS